MHLWFTSIFQNDSKYILFLIGTSKGSFLVIDTSMHAIHEIAQIVSVDFIGGIRHCYMQFFYYMDTGYHHSIVIKLQKLNNSENILKTLASSVSDVEG